MVFLKFKIGDYVTRSSHKNDVVFKIVNVDNNTAYLKRINVKLSADADLSYLVISKNFTITDEEIKK